MAKKGGMPIYKTVEDYIDSQSDEAQLILRSLRSLIKELVPEAIEIPNSKVPSFILVPDKKSGQQLMIAGYKNYVSFYPSQTTIEHFAEDLNDFELGKGTVKIPFDKSLPKDLIKEMILFRKQELLNK